VSGPACGICSDPALSLAIATLRGEGLTIEKVADRVKRPQSSVQRHLRHADTGRKRERRGGRPRKSDDKSHCSYCGFVTDAVDAQGLLKRAERLLWIAEGIASQAQADKDAKLTLAAVDRAAKALDVLARATGLIGDGGTNVVVSLGQQQRMTLETALQTILEQIPNEERQVQALRALQNFLQPQIPVLPAAIDA
jgi:transposase